MGLDASIPLQVKPPQIDDPLTAQSKALQLRDLMGQAELRQMQLQGQRAAAERQQGLRALYQGMPADMSEGDRIAKLRNAGYHDEADKWESAALKRDETRARITKAQYDAVKTRTEALNKGLGALKALGRPPTMEDIYGVVGELARQYNIPPEEQIATIKTLRSPADIPGWLASRQAQAADATKWLEMLAPKFEFKSTGKTLVPVDVNSWTNPTPQTLQMTTTPGEDLQAATARRGQNMADARAREGLLLQRDAARSQVLETSDGVMLIDKGTGIARQVTADGKPVSGKEKALTEGQAKALNFATRMTSADKTIGELEREGKVFSTPGSRTGFGVGAAINLVNTERGQKLDQAKRDFVNAVLRRESGAVISDSEFANADKQYFPQIGDSPEVIRQKARNRAIAIEGIRADVPKSYQDDFERIANTPAKPASKAPKVGTVEGGYVFTGGDPAKASNWKKVQ